MSFFKSQICLDIYVHHNILRWIINELVVENAYEKKMIKKGEIWVRTGFIMDLRNEQKYKI